MNNLMTKKNLLIIAGLLAAVKFAVLPLLAWQSDQIQILQVKSVQLTKVSNVLANQSTYIDSVSKLKAHMFESAERFYGDNSRTKLSIQTGIEEIFHRHQLTVEGFDWIVDSVEAVRLLRATVRFSGSAENMMRSFWDLAHLPTLVRQVESNQQLKDYGAGDLGSTKGQITLEFYALDDDYFDPDSNAEQNTDRATNPTGDF